MADVYLNLDDEELSRCRKNVTILDQIINSAISLGVKNSTIAVGFAFQIRLEYGGRVLHKEFDPTMSDSAFFDFVRELLWEVAKNLELDLILCPKCFCELVEVALFTSVDLECPQCKFRRPKVT